MAGPHDSLEVPGIRSLGVALASKATYEAVLNHFVLWQARGDGPGKRRPHNKCHHDAELPLRMMTAVVQKPTQHAAPLT
ncbi:hypothetical protein E2C01_017995 [Portunus trituberculatus]|uniref:Uncharacterized protein n=1 Tax=Portunus trituberculatus TaxID=210409 RepID=A0A5B7DTD4_PORTR|nr:hypothetical protein [Portunus trituberculatus]